MLITIIPHPSHRQIYTEKERCFFDNVDAKGTSKCQSKVEFTVTSSHERFNAYHYRFPNTQFPEVENLIITEA